MSRWHPWEIRYCPSTQEKYLCRNSTDPTPTIEVIGIAKLGTDEWRQGNLGSLKIRGTLPQMTVMRVPDKEELTALLLMLRKG